jgi:DNA polymerase-3 subunit delta'
VKFSEVIGQQAAKEQLLKMVEENRIPHALMLCGPHGCGSLALALAFASYLLCPNSKDGEPCGTCSTCYKLRKLEHLDLHFSFPVINKGGGGEKSSTSDDYMGEWRTLLLETPYIDINLWLSRSGGDNKQAQIMTSEGDRIQSKLAMKSFEGEYKVLVMWLPERMRIECANKLLKIIEEPPTKTIFLLVSENPEALLPTILSRVQRINLKKIDNASMAQALMQRNGLDEAQAHEVAHIANGDYIKALEVLQTNEEEELFFDLFVQLMRLSYMRKIKDMKIWSEQVAAMGRERQKHFLTYCQRLLRENFMYNFHQPELVYMNRRESDFSVNFARFINERNVIKIMNELDLAQRDIEQNVNAKMVFFDFALKMIVLLIQ